MSKYKYNTNYFKKIDNPDKAYWLGFLYADGSIVRFYSGERVRSMTLEISLAYKDKKHLEKFKECIESDIPIFERTTKCKGKSYKSVRIQLNNTEICEDLCKLGCVPNKTYIIKFPTFDIVPKEYMRDFIRGYFDGDGCICTTIMGGKPHIILNITGMSDMLKSVSDFLISENILRTMPKLRKASDKNKAYMVFYYGTDSIKEILDYLYKDSNMYLDRKHKKYIDFYKDYDDKACKRGVYYDKRVDRYIANIRINGKPKSKHCKTLDEAIAKRKQLEVEKMIKESPQNQ